MKATKSDAEKKAAVLVKEETRKKGRVGLDVYRRYLSSGAGECAISLLLLLGFVAPEGDFQPPTFQLSAASFFSAFGFQLSAFSFQLSAFSFQLAA